MATANGEPVLTPSQQEQLDAVKVVLAASRSDSAQVQTKIDNERYLRSHPELPAMLGEFTRYHYHVELGRDSHAEEHSTASLKICDCSLEVVGCVRLMLIATQSSLPTLILSQLQNQQ